MIGIVMAGGKGNRMALDQEKLLLKYKKPIIIHVINALKKSKCFSKIIAVTSPNAPKTKEFLRQLDIEIFDTLGNGYAKDLNQILTSLSDHVFVTSGDLPFLDENMIKKIVGTFDPENDWISIVITKKFLDSLHISSDYMILLQEQQCYFTGISLINANKIKNLNFVKEIYQIIDDKRIAFNVNTKQDYELLRIS